MPAACLLLAIATASGTLLTFLFDRRAPRGARLCMGACIGLVLMATLGYMASSWLGLGWSSIFLTAICLLLPMLLFASPEYRSLIRNSLWPSPVGKQKSSGTNVGYLTFYLAIAILLGMVFSRAVFERPDGIYTGVANNLGDLPLHLQVINSFSQGSNLPPEDPTYAGVRFAYPFLVDFEAAMLVRAGASAISAMWIQNMVLALALVGLLHYWTWLLTRNRLAGVIAPLLVIFSGGLGWWLIFNDVDSGILSHDYTIVPNSILRWGNSLTTLFVTQRSILFGMPLAIFIFSQWWLAISQQEDAAAVNPASPQAAENNSGAVVRSEKLSAKQRKKMMKAVASLPPEPQNVHVRRFVAAGLCAGLLPLVHAHTFLVVMGMAACLAVIFHRLWRCWLVFFPVALIVAAPELLWLARTGGVNTSRYLAWQPGWDHANHNVLWFWFANTGLFIPLLIISLLLRKSGSALPQRVLKYYAPFLLCFIVPNLVRLAPWIWDNMKVLFLWYVASTPLVAWLMARWWQQRSALRWLAPPVLAVLIAAGALDVLRVVTEATEYREFDVNGIAIAGAISSQAAPRAVILHMPTYNTPVFLTGRRSLLGFPAWMWSRGIDFSQRSADIQSIYSGAPNAEAIMRRYRVDYVLIGPEELASYKVDGPFWSHYRTVAQSGPYRLLKTSFEPAE